MRELLAFDDGGGSALYAAGIFTTAGDHSANGIARWDGSVWKPLGGGLTGVAFPWAFCLAVFDDGSGPALYVGGQFTLAGGVPAPSIARWDGNSWSPLGSGMGGADVPRVYALTVFDDGTGPALYAGGQFQTAGGIPARFIARWDGAVWSPLASETGTYVRTLAVFDDGGGPALYAGGPFTSVDGQPAGRIARWDGTAWDLMGGGVDAPWQTGPNVSALFVHDDGQGPALFVGGSFEMAGGVPASNIARWDGLNWSPLGSGVSGASTPVYGLGAFDGGPGNGPALYASGNFNVAGGQAVSNIARWDGATWSPLGDGLSSGAHALRVFDDGSGQALFLGGFFSTSPAGDSHFAKWGCPPTPLGTAFCFGDGSGTPCPCGNDAAAGRGCKNRTGLGSRLLAVGSSSVSAADLVLRATQVSSSRPGLFLQGDQQANGGLGTVFGDGLLCLSGSLLGLEFRGASSSGAASTTVDVAGKGLVQPGQTKHYQFWYRDPYGSPCQEGFNTTNGLEITWEP